MTSQTCLSLRAQLRLGWGDINFSDAEIAACVSTLQFEVGSGYIRQQQDILQLGIIHTGAFRLYYFVGKKEMNIRFLLEGDALLDYNQFLSAGNHNFHFEALEKTEILFINLTKLFAGKDQSFIQSGINKLITEYIVRISTEHIGANLFMSCEERYIRFFNENPEIFNRVPLYHIASYLGMEKESLSRIRRTIIEKNKRKLQENTSFKKNILFVGP